MWQNQRVYVNRHTVPDTIGTSWFATEWKFFFFFVIKLCDACGDETSTNECGTSRSVGLKGCTHPRSTRTCEWFFCFGFFFFENAFNSEYRVLRVRSRQSRVSFRTNQMRGYLITRIFWFPKSGVRPSVSHTRRFLRYEHETNVRIDYHIVPFSGNERGVLLSIVTNDDGFEISIWHRYLGERETVGKVCAALWTAFTPRVVIFICFSGRQKKRKKIEKNCANMFYSVLFGSRLQCRITRVMGTGKEPCGSKRNGFLKRAFFLKTVAVMIPFEIKERWSEISSVRLRVDLNVSISSLFFFFNWKRFYHLT